MIVVSEDFGVPVTCWGENAIEMSKAKTKSAVKVTGHLKRDEWKTKGRDDRERVVVEADTVKLLKPDQPEDI